MTEIVKESWEDFLKSLSDKEGGDFKLPCELVNLFDEQKFVDRLHKNFFKAEVNQILKLYLSQMDLITLRDNIKSHRKNFERGFGKDRLNHLKLLVSLLIIDEGKKPKKGLLAS